jgi:hypothetical protein
MSVFKNALKKDVGNSFIDVCVAPPGAAYLIQLDIACMEDSGVQVTIQIEDVSAGTSVTLIKGAPIPAGSSIQIIDGQKIVLEAGDKLKVKCDTTNSKVDVIASLIENIN